jgi:diguanylate cyclase (GGDEF)-like protein
VFIDIDHFKAVNDTYGHETGDDLLINFVKRIQNSLPEGALVARISGDEFAVLLEELREEAHLRELMEEVFSSMQRPFRRGEIETSITCSAGCVLTDGTAPPEEIMRVADKTMYQAKFEGRNRYLVESIVQLT